MQKRRADFPLHKAKGIRMLILDVDGVMTAGNIIMDHSGEEWKAFNVRDGHGIKMLQRAGIRLAILTGRTSGVVASRARELGIEYVVQGSLKKSEGLDALLGEAGLSAADCAYMGDDIVDLPPMRRCRLSFAPRDAHAAVLKAVDWVSDCDAGRGAVRQVIEGLILANDAWPSVVEGPYGVTPADCGWNV
jgi:3-deoxy-D-manno-octulosonate 8-phosphate phosphatase (KDO 8-P phosphatase)